MERLSGQLRFITEADLLKSVQRQTVLADAGRRENPAEHSWHIALMAITLAEYAPPGTDIARVVAMLLVHDLVEIDAGDLFVFASEQQHQQQAEAERAAAQRIFGLLPADQAKQFRALWEEFEERRTAEARFARALDRLQPMLANFRPGGGTWAAHRISAGQVLAKAALVEDGSPELGRVARELISRGVADGLLTPDGAEQDARPGQ
jgi:putative hydrolase of HD superfamily